VAQPDLVPESERHGDLLARPDDLAPDGRTWREIVRDYNVNSTQAGNPLQLWPAYKLYRNAAYGRLVDRFGHEDVFILCPARQLTSS